MNLSRFSSPVFNAQVDRPAQQATRILVLHEGFVAHSLAQLKRFNIDDYRNVIAVFNPFLVGTDLDIDQIDGGRIKTIVNELKIAASL